MRKLISNSPWLFVTLVLSFTILQLHPIDWSHILAVMLVWLLPLLHILDLPFNAIIANPLRLLRLRPLLFWLLLLIYMVAILIRWLHTYQPAVALPVTPTEWVWLWGGIWGFCTLLFFGLDEATIRASSKRLEASRWTGLLISLTTIVLLGFGTELWMRYYLLMPDGIGKTKMHENWRRVYGWLEPTNSLGYRDYEPTYTVADDVQRIVIVGDSFVAGQGIPHVDDIFAQQLATRLGDNYTVNAVAVPGAATAWEYNHLLTYPIEADIVVLSYYVNDIEGAVRANNIAVTGITPPDPENQLVQYLIQETHLGNFLYWHAYYPQYLNNLGSYLDRNLAYYHDETIWRDHQRELQNFVTYRDTQEVPMVVLVWPFLREPIESLPITDKVAAFFVDNNIPVIRLEDALSTLSVDERVVSLFDAHPSIATHTLAADMLFDWLTTQAD